MNVVAVHKLGMKHFMTLVRIIVIIGFAKNDRRKNPSIIDIIDGIRDILVSPTKNSHGL